MDQKKHDVIIYVFNWGFEYALNCWEYLSYVKTKGISGENKRRLALRKFQRDMLESYWRLHHRPNVFDFPEIESCSFSKDTCPGGQWRIDEKRHAANSEPFGKKIYLATPYTDKDPTVRQERYEMARNMTAKLMNLGYCVFSPIVHGHSLGSHFGVDRTYDHDFWMRQDLPLLMSSHVVFVFPPDAASYSRGVAKEVETAGKCNIPVMTELDDLIVFLGKEETVR